MEWINQSFLKKLYKRGGSRYVQRREWSGRRSREGPVVSTSHDDGGVGVALWGGASRSNFEPRATGTVEKSAPPGPWKTLRVSHFPTASTTAIICPIPHSRGGPKFGGRSRGLEVSFQVQHSRFHGKIFLIRHFTVDSNGFISTIFVPMPCSRLDGELTGATPGCGNVKFFPYLRWRYLGWVIYEQISSLRHLVHYQV